MHLVRIPPRQTLSSEALTALFSTNLSARARVILVGSGRMGHIRSSLLYGNPRFELAGIVDVNEKGATVLASTFQVRVFLS
jgi:hypothetical protein